MYAGGAKQSSEPVCEMLAFFMAGDEPQDTDCWPDNWLPLQIFGALGTQWNVGPGGVVGLKYESLATVFEEFEIKKTERAELINALRTMETEALQVINQR